MVMVEVNKLCRRSQLHKCLGVLGAPLIPACRNEYNWASQCHHHFFMYAAQRL